MPPRNFYAIILALFIAIWCYGTAERGRDAAPIGDAMYYIDRYYVDEVDKRTLLEGAMEGLSAKLDPYSQFFPPGAYEQFQDAIQQEFAGIGAVVEQPDPGQPTRIITPLVGSPALAAGLLPKDEIIAVGEIATDKMPLTEVVEMLRGPIGSVVEVRIRRTASTEPAARTATADGNHGQAARPAAASQTSASEQPAERTDSSPAEPPRSAEVEGPSAETKAAEGDQAAAATTQELVFQVRRDNIHLESVVGDHRDAKNRWVYRLREAPQVAYIRLTGFGERTTAELRQTLEKLDNRFDGLILDLRGNAGGLLTSAVEICDMFLDQGRIVSTRGRGVLRAEAADVAEFENAAWDASQGILVASHKPVMVLIDGNSASASEIVAACLKDHGRATIVGERSFGKGSVQNLFPLENGRSALKLTTARYYRPNGHNIHRDPDDTEEDEWGVVPHPDFVVPLDEQARRSVLRRWEVATYPTFAKGVAPTAAPADDAESDSLAEVDPQLWRALEALRGQPVSTAKEAASPPAEAGSPT